MTEYLLATRELMASIATELETQTGNSALLRLVRAIAEGEQSEYVRALVEQLPPDERIHMLEQRLARAEKLMRRCQPLIKEGGRHVTTDSVTYGIEQFLREPYASLYR